MINQIVAKFSFGGECGVVYFIFYSLIFEVSRDIEDAQWRIGAHNLLLFFIVF
jgi:hypothetical protein